MTTTIICIEESNGIINCKDLFAFLDVWSLITRAYLSIKCVCTGSSSVGEEQYNNVDLTRFFFHLSFIMAMPSSPALINTYPKVPRDGPILLSPFLNHIKNEKYSSYILTFNLSHAVHTHTRCHTRVASFNSYIL